MTDLRQLPSVDQLLQSEEISACISAYGRPLTLQAIREVLERFRSNRTQIVKIPDSEGLIDQVQQTLVSWTTPSLRSVINATGVILHTNLGRAPLSQAAVKTVEDISLGYSTLEFSLSSGKRGARGLDAEALLRKLTGAQAALVVNNNAAAVLLVLTALARRRKMIIARSQLVEIGGGFRVPDVMKESGTRLVEVGTTNRVHLEDYQKAIEGQSVAAILRAHRSNFQIVGFTSEPDLSEITLLAHQNGIWMIDDLGSGCLLHTEQFGLAHEPMVQESMAAGVDLVCFSGDKLLGGPQAGIIVGKRELIEKIRKHPLARAVRADKLCQAALSATLLHYLRDEAVSEIPVWQMIAETTAQIHARAEAWSLYLGQGSIRSGESTIGGGSLPGETLPTKLLALQVASPDRAAARLRSAHPPVIARVHENLLVFDPRTVLPEQESTLLKILKELF